MFIIKPFHVDVWLKIDWVKKNVGYSRANRTPVFVHTVILLDFFCRFQQDNGEG